MQKRGVSVVALLLAVVGFCVSHVSAQSAGGAAAAVTGQAQLLATTTEAAKAALKGDKNTEVLLHGQKQSTNMLRSMLMANSQQMFAINQLQKEVARMRKRLDRHEEDVFKCKKKLDEYQSAQEQLSQDAVLADTIEEPSFLQVHLETLKRQSAEAHTHLHALLGEAETDAASVKLRRKERLAPASLLERGHRRHRLRRQRIENPDPPLEYDAEEGSIVHEGGPTEAEKREMLEQNNRKMHRKNAEEGNAWAPADALNWETPEMHDTELQDAMYDFTGKEYKILKKSENTPEKIAIRRLKEVNALSEHRRHRLEEEEEEEDSDSSGENDSSDVEEDATLG